jgi:cytochrome P450
VSGRTPPGLETPLSAADVQEDPLAFLSELTTRFGDVARYTVDGRAVVFVNRPEHARHVLQERHRAYSKVGTPDMMMLRPMLGDGLLTTDGDTWMRQRRLAAPAFHRARVEGFGELIVEETIRTLEGWAAHAASGAAFEVGEELTRLTTRVIARALFGADVGELVESFGAAVQAMNEFMGHYDPHDRERLRRFLEARGVVDALVHRIISDRRGTRATPPGEDGGDFLDVLLGARDEVGQPLPAEEVRDQVMTLLMAGHETTAKALTWTLHLLDRHPPAAEAVRAEAEGALAGRAPTVADLPCLPTGWQVLQEAMRLYPPVWIIARTAAMDDEIGGWAVPRGTLVLVSPWTLHRHPDVWERPDAFDPDRFLPEREAERPPFAFLPFSGGPRQCIGKHLASVESQLALTLVLLRFQVEVVPGHPVEPEALVTLRPRHGLPVVVTRRAES